MGAGLIIVWSVLGFFVVWLVTFTIKSHIESEEENRKLLDKTKQPLKLPAAKAVGEVFTQ